MVAKKVKVSEGVSNGKYIPVGNIDPSPLRKKGIRTIVTEATDVNAATPQKIKDTEGGT
jgi:hypothetical protein